MPAPRTLSLPLCVAAALLLAPGGRAWACASCTCGDPTLTATGVERPYRHRVRVALEERLAEHGAGDEDSWTLRSMLALSYSPSTRVTLTARLPWVTSWLHLPGHRWDELNGLGDLELGGRVVVFRERSFAPRHVLWLAAGLKAPTGPRARDGAGYPYADDDQPGTGSWDPFGGATYAWFGGRFSVFASAAYRQATPGWRGYRRGYRRGSVFGFTSSAQFEPWSWGALAVGLDGSWTESDHLTNGAAAPDSGGFMLHLAPALLAAPLRDLLLRLAVEVPVAHARNGTQRDGTQIVISIAWDLH